MSEKIISPFQMHDWRIRSFQYSDPIFPPALEKVNLTWKLTFHKDYKYKSENKCYAGMLSVRFAISADGYSNDFLTGEAISFSTLSSENDSEEAQRQMDRLLSINAAAYTLGALRSFLIQQSVLMLRMQIILPSINLNNVEFDKEYTLGK